ncbi:MAG: hypothetical protein L0387_26115 [Acidobacteria bacterium]|nr:hypothetical protein [Acidobacteriota bacterium]
MKPELGELILLVLFLAIAVGLRVWAHLKSLPVRDQLAQPPVQAAYDALRSAVVAPELCVVRPMRIASVNISHNRL